MLWPDRDVYDKQLSDNNLSLVCLITFADSNVLLCSDIEKFAQQKLLQINPGLKAGVVVAPHHGSARTLDTDFLRNLDAETMICSCSRRQYQQSSALWHAFTTKDTPPAIPTVLSTAEKGAIRICIDKSGRVTISQPAK